MAEGLGRFIGLAISGLSFGLRGIGAYVLGAGIGVPWSDTSWQRPRFTTLHDTA